MPILEGFIIGLAMVVFVGPVFFTLIQNTIQHGLRAGFAVAMGILISDTVIIALCSVWAVGYFEEAQHQLWLAWAGVLLLFVLGLKYIFKPDVGMMKGRKPSALLMSSFFAQGFVVNFVNPFVFMVWISVIATANARYANSHEMYYYLGAALFAIILTDAAKVILAQRIQKHLNAALLKKILRIVGILLIGFCVRLLYFIFSS